MTALNVSANVFEATVDAYDPDCHWGGISIYPEGPLPTEVKYPGLPAGMTLPPGIPIHLDLFVTPAPPHLAHIPLECPGAPRLDRKPAKPRAIEPTPLETNTTPKHGMGLYGPAPRLPCSRPTFVYAYPHEGERWAHQPEHLRPVEANPKVQIHTLVPPEESYEREVEPVSLRVSRPWRASSLDQPRTNKALRNFRAQFGEST
ncbi:unnamed protein product [Rhizoctonia solani]|uniref:Uncharacterized protein n=1 Tax=Rhizoctonia solani TaxID=456999 RepID=A0A8H3C0Z8_9AGAM|nr:unnamed protein product [Rhizoctonia solani]